MSSVILLLVVIIASVVCVRAGAIALQLTGMDIEKAKFQALSSFTNTGFTTRESEEITRFPIRRRIIVVLIILGHAGTVSVIAALANSLLQSNIKSTIVNIAIVVVCLYLFYRLALVRGITSRSGEAIRKWLRVRYHLHAPSLEEMLKVSEGFGVVRVVVEPTSAFANQPLRDLGLKARKIQILSIQRGDDISTIPEGDHVLLPGDELTCYGAMDAIANAFSAGHGGDPAPLDPEVEHRELP